MLSKSFVTLILIGVIIGSAFSQRTFTKRVGFNVKGKIVMIGNVNVRGYTSSSGNTTGGNNSGSANNDSYYMRHVDVDSDGSTFNSSSADLSLPVPSDSILWAGLYWHGYSVSGYSQSGVSANAYGNRFKIKFRKDGGAYTTYTAAQQDDIGNYNYRGWYAYQGYYDVTDVVRTGGSGTYYAANIVTPYNDYGICAGWSLVVVYKDFSNEPLRNLVIWDGYRVLDPNSSETITLTGFKTPSTGTVTTNVGSIAFEGDAGLTDDRLRLGPTVYLSDAQNPSTNFFNSSISMFGTRFSNKNPDFSNQLGYDIDIVSTSGVLGNDITSTTVRFRTDGDLYYPGVMSFETESKAPAVTVEKRFYESGSNTYSVSKMVGIPPNTIENRTVQYHFNIENIGDENALNVVLLDTIPPLQDYLAGTMQVSMDGVNWSTLTDASDTDAGYFDAANDRVVVGVGNFATSANGGQLLKHSIRYVRFQTLIEEPSTFTPPPPGYYEAPNFARVAYADTGAYLYDANSNGVVLTIDNALPVELVAFAARAIGHDTRLTWRTATESNNHGFEIQRQCAGGEWKKVGFTDGGGTVNTPRDYTFVDKDADRVGTSLRYRLKQIDRTGGFEYSNPVVVSFFPPAGLTLSAPYPNPAVQGAPVTLSYASTTGTALQIFLYDVHGRELRHITEESTSRGISSATLLTGDLPAGHYTVILTDGSDLVTRPLVIGR